jgi:hypothetical protein
MGVQNVEARRDIWKSHEPKGSSRQGNYSFQPHRIRCLGDNCTAREKQPGIPTVVRPFIGFRVEAFVRYELYADPLKDGLTAIAMMSRKHRFGSFLT